FIRFFNFFGIKSSILASLLRRYIIQKTIDRICDKTAQKYCYYQQNSDCFPSKNHLITPPLRNANNQRSVIFNMSQRVARLFEEKKPHPHFNSKPIHLVYVAIKKI